MFWGSGKKPTWPGVVVNQNVSSTGQSGGITAHTVNMGPRRRNLDGAEGVGLKAQMLSELPRDKVINVSSVMNDHECFHFAAQIRDFLRQNGFRVGPEMQAMYMNPPRGISVCAEEAEVEFIVAPE